MSSSPSAVLPQSYTEEEISQAHTTAREALGYIASFGTPPTPDVYEVWYCYAEGGNEALNEALEFPVKEAKSITRTQLEQIRQQFFSAAESAESNARVSEGLAEEIGGLQSLVRDQLAVNTEFDSSVSTAIEELRTHSIDTEAGACIDVLQVSNERMQGQLSQLNNRLEDSQQQIDRLRDSVLESQKLLMTDPVTGVGNRRFFDTMIAKFANGDASGTCRFLLLMDLDEFKDVNDTFGHAAGDEVLRFVATRIQAMARDASVARYGGDEFAVFLNADDPSQGKEVADSMCSYFAKNSFTHQRSGESLGRITTSIGVALLREEDTVESWFDRADKLLFSAKNSGRSCAMIERNLRDA